MATKKQLVALLIPIALLIGGCCHPPVKQISMAKAQLMEAREAGAPLYAPEKYKEAEILLSQAEAESKKECNKSWKTVKFAQKKAAEAKEDALKKKADAKVSAQKALEEAQEALKAAQEVEASQYAPDLYQVACSTLKEAVKSFKGEDYVQALQQAKRAAKLAKRAKDAAIKVKEELAGKGNAKTSTHVVQKGECLWAISSHSQIYNDPLLWPLIYWANKAQIKDPDLICPGQVLFLPRSVPGEEKEKAISFARHRVQWSLFDGK
jgi:nucleoid-associated protein YgaU